MNTRRTQPYRQGSTMRQPGPALDAQLAGRTAHGYNPQDVVRDAQTHDPGYEQAPSRPKARKARPARQARRAR